MIKKLYNLKKLQTDRNILQKQQCLNKIIEIDEEIEKTEEQIITATVDKFGAISDFSILEIHKNSMRSHILKLQRTKRDLLAKVDNFNKIIIELQKESEQFNYILQQQKKEQVKQMLKDEALASDEYIQAKWNKR